MECLIDLVFEVLPDAQHESKWGQLTFTLDGDWHHWICALSPTKKAVKLVIHKGHCWPIRVASWRARAATCAPSPSARLKRSTRTS